MRRMLTMAMTYRNITRKEENEHKVKTKSSDRREDERRIKWGEEHNDEPAEWGKEKKSRDAETRTRGKASNAKETAKP